MMRFMKPDIHEFKQGCPEADEGLLGQHLSRPDDRYFKRFGEEEICRHLIGLSGLSPENPVELLLDAKRDGTVDCTVVAFDYPYEFSMITGIFAGSGFRITSGDIFTY